MEMIDYIRMQAKAFGFPGPEGVVLLNMVSEEELLRLAVRSPSAQELLQCRHKERKLVEKARTRAGVRVRDVIEVAGCPDTPCNRATIRVWFRRLGCAGGAQGDGRWWLSVSDKAALGATPH